MILEPFELKSLPGIFDDQLLNFLIEDWPDVKWERIKINNNRTRYELMAKSQSLSQATYAIFGEIERSSIKEELLHVKTAIVDFEIDLAGDFFMSFYQYIRQNWGYAGENIQDCAFSSFMFISLQILLENSQIPIDVIGEEYNGSETIDRILSFVKHDQSNEIHRDEIIADLFRRLPPIDSYREYQEAEQQRKGSPGLSDEELIYRLAKAMEAEEMRKAHPNMRWKEIAVAIDWNVGGTFESNIKLLKDARDKLKRYQDSDPKGLLEKAYAWKEKKTNQ